MFTHFIYFKAARAVTRMSVNVFWTPSIPADEHLLHTLTIIRSLSIGNDNGIEHAKKQHKLHCGLETFAKYFHIYYLS